MSVFGHFAREYMRQRAYGRRRRHYGWGRPQRHYGWGYPQRTRSPWGMYGRSRPRTRVRVFGCCLPFPIGGLALLLGLKAASDARRSR